jgi:tripartite-type tricarboxylate transporter receptor subunit TctC
MKKSYLVLILCFGIFMPLQAKTLVEVIVSASPGNGPDLVARVIADILNDHEYTAVVRNVPGAAGELAVGGLLRSDKSKATLLLTQNSIVTINPHVRKRPEQKLWEHSTPVFLAGKSTTFLIAQDKSVRSLRELFDKKARAGEPIRFASMGIGSLPHLILEDLLQRYYVDDRIHVPYRGAAESIQGMLSGDVDLLISGVSAIPFVTSGRLNALAIVGDQPSAQHPYLPMLSQQHKDLVYGPWFGLFASSHMPSHQVQHIRALLTTGFANNRERLSSLGVVYDFVPQSQLENLMEQEYEFFKKITRRLRLDQIEQ